MQEVVCSERCPGCGGAGAAMCLDCRRGLLRSPLPCSHEGGARVLTALAYEGPARSAVLALKLRGQRTAAAPLVEALAAHVRKHGLLAEVVAWVPGRRRDIRRRGFDHARVLAEGVAGLLGLPLVPLVTRSGHGSDQSGLTKEARWMNVAGLFRAERCRAPVAVVDDLVTTGATAAAVTSALAAQGTQEIEILAACRAPLRVLPQPQGSARSR